MKILRLAPIFTDCCVLQRRKPIRVFGVADEDMEIQVSLTPVARTPDGTETTPGIQACGAQSPSTASARSVSHVFTATLPPLEAGGPYTLTVSSPEAESIILENIMVGEVWLAGGQSNMEYALEADKEYDLVCQRASDSNVRFFQVNRKAYFDEYFYLDERREHWMLPDDELGSWSAVGYFFAEKLAAELGLTVGVIGCNWGGTSACAWQDAESICSHEDTRIYWDEYIELIEKQDPESYEKERLDYIAWHKDWQPRMDAYYAAHPNAEWTEALAAVGECRWPGPMGPKHEFRPCGLYETMLKRVVPYTLAGFIYYQGESDDHRPHSYYHLFKSLIGVWRRDFLDENLPFLFVQLPMHQYLSDEPKDNWCYIREAQMQVHKDIPNTGIAVAIDCGEFNNIHPTRKAEVGKRLALQALCHVYGSLSAQEAYGPLYRSCRVEGSEMRIELDYAEGGLTARTTPVTGFEIAGPDNRYHPARVRIDGSGLILSCPDVPVPVCARYLWYGYGPVCIYGAGGLPLAPFHTAPIRPSIQ